MSASRAPVVIIGIGNPMRQDDGVGPAVIEALASDPIEGCDLVQLEGETTRLLEAWRDRRLALVVDAVSAGAPAGTIHEVGAEVLLSMPSSRLAASSHSPGLAHAIELGQVLGRLPTTLRVVGVEPADLAHGPDMSSAVAKSIPSVVQRVRSAVLAGIAGITAGAHQ